MATVTLHPTRLDLPDSVCISSISLLSKTLATLIDLHSQTKQAHWNVIGPQFIALHELFDATAAELYEAIDTVAERITALSGKANGTIRQAVAKSELSEFPNDMDDGLAFVAALSDQFAVYTKLVRENSDQAADLGDVSTADLFTGLSRDADKRLWFLEAHLR
jgi:starvation-inducible DNA-binding protein